MDSQVLSACRFLVRYAGRRGLSGGDRLPSQAELVALSEFSNNTLTPALGLLAESGFLQKKRKSGCILDRPEALPPTLWRVAIPYAAPDDRPGGVFSAMFLVFLQDELQRRHCRCRLHPRLSRNDRDYRHELDHFADLEEDFAHQRIDGVVSGGIFSRRALTRLAGAEVPFCHLGETSQSALRLEFPLAAVVAAALARFRVLGVRKPLLVCGGAPEAGARREAEVRFRSAAEAHGMAVGVGSVLAGTVDELMRGAPGHILAGGFDGLVVLNDFVASAVSIICLREGRAPALAVQTSRQIALSYALPAIRYEFDLAALARTAADLLLAALSGRRKSAVEQGGFTERLPS